MPRKKKEAQELTEMPADFIGTPEEGIVFDFTGKMNIIIEQVGYGPMQLLINDKDFVLKVLKLFVEFSDGTTPVGAYNAREEKKLKKMMDNIK